MKKRGKVLLVLSATMVTLVGSVLPVSAAPTYADLFDAEYYAGVYSDVAAAYGDDEEALFNHYINYGIYEGRVGSEAFNVLNYRENYADLEAAYGDDWKSYVDHYLTFGLVEGRDSGGMFDAVSYANRYPDLKEAYGYDVTKLWAHYEQFGMKEGRNPVSQSLVNEWAAAAAKVESAKTNTGNNTPTETPTETPAETQAPLILSGNAEDSYTTTRPEYVETDKFVLYLDENITVQGNTADLISKILQRTEEVSGFTLTNDIGYDSGFTFFAPYEFYGETALDNVDPENEKYHIYVVAPEKCGPCGSVGCLVLNQIDLDIAGGEGWVLVHEYSHSLHMANGVYLDQVMTEGFATYNCGQVINNSPDIYFNFNANYNYSCYNREITPENAEAIFLEDKEDGWEDYLYGYRFMTFLTETYGEDIFRVILTDASMDAGQWEYSYEGEKVIPYIKANTSEDVFVEFANWLEENKDRIDAWQYEY